MNHLGFSRKINTILLIVIMTFSMQFLNNLTSVNSQYNTDSITPEQVNNPLYLNMIWHQHQPTYLDPSTDIYELPWVYMHATNNYPWMADLHKKYPEVNASINITPSLLKQLSDYTSEVAYDRRIEVAKMDESLMTDENKTEVLQFFFDINPQYVTGRYAYLQDKSSENPTMAEKLTSFTNAEILDLKVMFFLRWINEEYRSFPGANGDFQLSNMDSRIDTGNNATTQFGRSDLNYVLQKGLELAQSTVQRHVDAINQGNLEMITTPFFHPILPLLIDLNSSLESPGNEQLPLPEGTTGWTDDAQEQINRGVQSFIDTYTGAAPKGMWPSEQSVSKAVVPLMANAGIDWFVGDQKVLQNSLGVSELTPEAQYRMYAVNEGSSSIASVYRDTRISDDIGFVYSGMDPEKGAQQFIDSIRAVYDKLDTNQEDYLLTLALDGENAWEHYSFDIDNDGDNEYTGNLFRELVYQKLIIAQNEGWLKTTTPSQYLKTHPIETLPDINNLASGSWIEGELNTWIGESQENIAWDWLIDAREALVAADLASTTLDSAAAWDALYAAEGSDWFWWYGTDQNSLRDETFDWGFKTLLRNVYENIGFTDDEISLINPLLFLQQKPTIQGAYPGKMTGYTIDGLNSTDEWNLSYFINDSVTEDNAIESLYSGINNDVTDLLFNVELRTDNTRAANNDFIGLYFNDPNIGSGDIYPIGAVREIENALGFQLNFAVTYNYNNSQLNFWANDGTGWLQDSSISGNAVSSANFFEISIPLTFFNYTPGDFFLMSVHYSGLLSDVAPEDGPVSFQVPTEVDFDIIFQMEDPEGDEYGPYATSPDFDPGFGLFDILDFAIGYDDNNLIASIEMNEIRNPWGAPSGFSHPLIQVYIDTDRISGSGNTEPDQNANVLIHEDFAWETMIRADGWVSYGLNEDMTQYGGVTGSSDLLNNRITISAPLSITGTPTSDWAFVVLVGSQDFQAYRERFAEEGIWKFGGGDDGEYDPNVIDMLVPEGFDQSVILSDWDVGEQRQAKMIGVGPNVGITVDDVSPEVTITSPSNNDEFRLDSDGQVNIDITFTATDNENLDHYDLFVGNIQKVENGVLTSGANSVTIQILESEVVDGSVTVRINVYDANNEDQANIGSDSISLQIKKKKSSDDGFLPIEMIIPSLLIFAILPVLKNYRKNK